jgi:hypothetical protein
MKWCRACKKEKPLDEFHKHKLAPDGLRYECRDCRNQAHEQYRRSRGVPKRPILGRLLALSKREDDCVRWAGAHNPGGYGTLGSRLAHRAVAQAAGIALPPEGYDFHHKCRTHDCVNLAHIQILSRENHGLLSAAEAA